MIMVFNNLTQCVQHYGKKWYNIRDRVEMTLQEFMFKM